MLVNYRGGVYGGSLGMVLVIIKIRNEIETHNKVRLSSYGSIIGIYDNSERQKNFTWHHGFHRGL